jgi:serine/threonine protein kinase
VELLSVGSEVFGRFQVQEEIGGGGQSFGYRALDKEAPRHEPWRRNVFLKQFHDLIPGSVEAQALPQHFAKLREYLDDDANYICLPLLVGEAANSIIAVYDWLQGRTLHDYMEKDLTSAQCVRISTALVNASRKLHQNGIAHLDLKPSNIVIEEHRKKNTIFIRLIDLDAAQVQGEGLRDKVIGSNFYMSPEHYLPERFGPVSVASDIFAVGVILSELLFKQHPFVDASDYREAIINEQYSIPPNDYHYEVVEVITSSLSAEPEDRPTAGKILYTLNAHYDTNLEATSPTEKWPRQPLRDTSRMSGTTNPSVSSRGARRYVQLEGEGAAAGFQRTYYDSVVIDRNQLRGSRLNSVTQPLFRLEVQGESCVLTLLNDFAEVLLQNRRLNKGDAVELTGAQRLQIGSVSFRLSTKPY